MEHGHDGHRQRIMHRLETGALTKHELLETLLFPVMPRRNTNDVAHAVLSKFGSLRGAYAALKEELLEVEGVGKQIAELLFAMGNVHRAHYVRRKPFEDRYDPSAFFSPRQRRYAEIGFEVLDLYFLDGNGEMQTVHRFTEEKKDEVHLKTWEMTRLLEKIDPHGVILVHNHPKGDYQPSLDDIRSTEHCQRICNTYGIYLCDHVIFSPQGAFSFRAQGKEKLLSIKAEEEAEMEYRIERIFQSLIDEYREECELTLAKELQFE